MKFCFQALQILQGVLNNIIEKDLSLCVTSVLPFNGNNEIHSRAPINRKLDKKYIFPILHITNNNTS